MIRGKQRLWSVAIGIALLTSSLPTTTYAATTAPIPSDFNLQVSPSPLVNTVKPGVKSTLQLSIHNSSSGTENLQIQPRSFKYESKTGSVDLEDNTLPPIASWLTFSAPKFTVLSDQTFTENVTINVPKDAGFSYSFVLLVSRQSQPKAEGSEQIIAGSLAVFSLINVDRPGATSSLRVAEFSTSKRVYEYLPSTFSVRFTNDGNTISQPSGNIFVQRGNNDKSALATLPVNAKQGYILPGTSRLVSSSWSDGFPAYQTGTDADGKPTQKLVWNWANLSKLRIGRYTAKLVAVYNQGGHDVPLEGAVTFWVIPWKILSVLLVIILLLLFALYMMVRGIIRGVKGKRAKHAAKKANKKAASPTSDDNTQE